MDAGYYMLKLLDICNVIDVTAKISNCSIVYCDFLFSLARAGSLQKKSDFEMILHKC